MGWKCRGPGPGGAIAVGVQARDANGRYGLLVLDGNWESTMSGSWSGKEGGKVRSECLDMVRHSCFAHLTTPLSQILSSIWRGDKSQNPSSSCCWIVHYFEDDNRESLGLRTCL